MITQGTRNDASHDNDSLRPRLPRHISPADRVLQADEDRRLAESWERHREHVGAAHILHIGATVALCFMALVASLAVLGAVDSPQDHREPVMVREVARWN